ncbi:MAG: DUF2797 domain-containing protein [Flavobacteriales bacterium]|nr:DUF2797 domain-containing protein [Flavobacteriales bacterium]
MRTHCAALAPKPSERSVPICNSTFCTRRNQWRSKYPVLAYPPKVTSVSFEKQPVIGGLLMGIKGQYLLWEDGRVLNIRNQSGVHVVVEN